MYAFTVWNECVSPLFDAARAIAFVRPGHERETIDVSLLTVAEKVELLSRRGVDVLVCGAISRVPLAMLLRSDMRVMPYVRGRVEDICEALSEGRPLSDEHLLPGCSPMAGRCRTGMMARRGRGRGQYHRGRGNGTGRRTV